MKRSNEDQQDHAVKRSQPTMLHNGNQLPVSPNLSAGSPSPPRKKELKSYVGCSQLKEFELVNKLGEGTFGQVHKARRKDSTAGSTPQPVLAMKRILMHNENEGVPITALREIKILKRLRHQNIVPLLDIAVSPGSRSGRSRASIYMVFPYMDHDLSGLLNNPRVRLTQPQIKLYMKQLLEGTIYMHANKIIHRDMKAANLLISNDGTLKIADFGLARPFKPEGEDYTSKVVTRWYRPPELFLGEKKYGPAVDMWGIGCVFGEMLCGGPILQGNSDQDQLDKIFTLCGSPTEETMPGWSSLPGLEEKGVVYQVKPHSRGVYDYFLPYGGIVGADLMDKLLVLDPKKRLTAFAASDHDYLWTEPLPAEIGMLPQYEASHEYDRQRRNEAHQDRRNNNNTTTNFHGAQQSHGHHPSGRHGSSLPAGGGGNGGGAAPYRGHGNNGGGGYNPDHDRRGDKPRGGHPPPNASAAPAPVATSYRPIPLPPKPQAAAVPPAAPPVTNPIPTRRP
ncbi:serine/threonine protein kinase, CMGC, CDC2/CDK sub [Linnemannia schmuckeri]|uniref:Serine/threonine protein kinase, CMGC, CDC2/CDK sub n=1 Tax=Linnemannia schmuckeri TaxID=64567 RepID=A0A9P5RWC3_9FUNG|nr:serine/threonine protein kinase, CMGC, CDC2/CDK sub [Linnemannia schmuckeri]